MRSTIVQVLNTALNVLYTLPQTAGAIGQALALGADGSTVEWVDIPDTAPFVGTITGDGTTATFAVTHNKNSDYPAVAFYAADGRAITANYSTVDANNISVTPDAVLDAGVAITLSVRR